MKKMLVLLFFSLVCSKSYSLTIEVSNPNLRPFKVYVQQQNLKTEPIVNYLSEYLKLMPNIIFVDDLDNADFAISFDKKDSKLFVILTFLKTTENVKFEVVKLDDLLSGAIKLADMVYEKMTQSTGIFSTNIVFSMNWYGIRQIFISDISGRKIKKLTDNLTDSIAPKLSKDRQFVVYTRYFKTGGTSLRLINLRNLEDIPIYSSKGLNIAGSFSDDGKNVYFSSYDGKVSKIISYNIMTKDMQLLYTSRARITSPVLTYNKNFISFVSDELGGPQIYLLNLEDKSSKRLTYRHNYATSPSFAITGTHFVYVALVQGVNKVYAQSIDGNDFALLTPIEKSFEDPHWSRNERFVFALSSEKNSSSVYLIDISTLRYTKLFTLPAKIGYLYIN